MSEFNGSNYFQEQFRPEMAKLFDDVASRVIDLVPPEDWQKEFLDLEARSYRGVFESNNPVQGTERWYVDFKRDQTDISKGSAATELCIVRFASDQNAEVIAIKPSGTYKRARANVNDEGGYTYYQIYTWPRGFNLLSDRLYSGGELQLASVSDDNLETLDSTKQQDLAWRISDEYSGIKTDEFMDIEFAKKHTLGSLAYRSIIGYFERRMKRNYYYSLPIQAERITSPYKDVSNATKQDDGNSAETVNKLETTEQIVSTMANATHDFVNEVFATENDGTDTVYDTGSLVIQKGTDYWRISIDKSVAGNKLAKIEHLVTDPRAGPYQRRYSYSFAGGNSYIKEQRIGREAQANLTQTKAEDYLDSPGRVMEFCDWFTYKYTDINGQKLIWIDSIVVNEKQRHKLEQIDCNWRHAVNGDECECYQEHGPNSRVKNLGQGVARLFKRNN